MSKLGVLCLAAGIGGVALAGSETRADTVLHLDVNNFSVTVSGGPNVLPGATRTLSLFDDGDTELESLKINGAKLAGGLAVGDLAGTITTTAGSLGIASGTVSGLFTLTDTGDDGDVTTYNVPIVSGTYQTVAGLGIMITATTAGGVIDPGELFFGVDLSQFTAVQPLQGALLQFVLDPGQFSLGSGDSFSTDTSVDADITAVVPLPMAAWAGLGLMGAVGAVRLRRARLQPLA